MKKINKKGVTLIELLISLSIIFIISIIVFFVHQNVTENMKVNSTVNQINTIHSTIDMSSAIASEDEVFNSISNGSAFSPKSTMPEKKMFINDWGGDIAIHKVESSSESYYDIMYYNLPQSSCIKIVSRINGVYHKVENSNGEQADPKIMSEVAELCKGAENDGALVLSSLYTLEQNGSSNENTSTPKPAEKTQEEIDAENKIKEEIKKEEERKKKEDLRAINNSTNSFVFQWGFDMAEKNGYQSNSFSFMHNNKPYFVQGPRDAVKEFYVSIVNAKTKEDLDSIVNMTQLPNKLYSIDVGGTQITATYITDSSRDYYAKNFKKESPNNYKNNE